MTARFLSLLLAALPLAALQNETRLENSNFVISQGFSEGERVLYDYNRLRLYDTLRHKGWYAELIGDLKNYYGEALVNSEGFAYAEGLDADTVFATRSRSAEIGSNRAFVQLYRAYGGYADEQHTVTLGLQKISMGVGRIWSPTDLFNPQNPYALEPDEVYGVFGASYSYAFSDLAQAGVVVAQRKDHTFKYAARIKGYTGYGDAALDIIQSENALMVGYELEGDLFETGALLRSEGGYYREETLDVAFYQAIIGADYGFEEGTTVALEWLYSSKTFDETTIADRASDLPDNLMHSHHYIGATASRQFGLLWFGSLAWIENIDDANRYLAPSMDYSLSDEMTLSAGAMVFNGSGVGVENNSYYVRWFVAF